MTGRTLAHYEILDSIGEGGMGTVYKARDTRLNRTVAIKGLRGATTAHKTRFLQEAQAASALNHPNIVTVHDLLQHDGEDYIVMEHIQGRTLDRLIPKSGLRLDEVLKMAIPATSALTAAHEAGIVHRDVKPSNIMVRDDGGVKVLDFGLAKLTDPIPASPEEATRTLRAETEEGSILGTTSYMSPEQAEGKKVDARSDIFSFGAVLYEMVTGRRAFSGQSKLSTLSAILKEDPKPPAELGVEIPRELERIISHCLRKDIDRRYQLMKEVRNALQELKEDSDSGRLTVAAAPRPPNTRWLPYAAGLVGVVALGAAGFAYWRSEQKPPPVPQLVLRPITQDGGVTHQPTLSPDGKLLAYASNRAPDGAMDIWMQPLAQGAQPVRLTRHSAWDQLPRFSPDGGQIAFCSARDGGGVYIMPTFGGEERLLLRGNYGPAAFSPDGKFVAASDGQRSFIVPTAGGERRQIAPGFHWPRIMQWSPDGSKLLLGGSPQQGTAKEDWWLVNLSGGAPVPLNADKFLSRNMIGLPPMVTSWNGDFLYYSTRNLHRIRIDVASNSLIGPPERLTSGASAEQGAAVVPFASQSGLRIAFASYTEGGGRLVSLAIQPNSGQVAGKPETLFRDAFSRVSPSLSADNSLLAYVRRDPDGQAIRVLDRKSGAERTVFHQSGEMRARISPDGSTVAYNRRGTDEKETDIFLVSSMGGAAKKACDKCGLLYDWALDGKRLLYRSGSPMRFWTFDVGSGQSAEILSHPRYQLAAAAFSSDNRWLAFNLAPGDNPSHIFVTPVRDGRGAPESEWIPIFTRPGYNTRPWWSPDGKLIYFSSDASGVRSIWAQRFDAAARKPVGEGWIVYTPDHGAGIIQGSYGMGVGFAANTLIFGTIESRANVWLAE